MTLARIKLAGIVACTALLMVVGCAKDATPPVPAGVIDRETFVSTFVELRDAAMAMPLKVLDDGDRERILSAHGVTEEQLLAFADAYGGDPSYMVGVWDEVKSRMKPLAPVAPTVVPDTLQR